jgi:hypothetical protein
VTEYILLDRVHIVRQKFYLLLDRVHLLLLRVHVGTYCLVVHYSELECILLR